ncbi:MAG: hypothetical protein CMK75_06930, partial [Pseudomonadales bacterium]|nr:hypothetical protein [Pseudomonadales bacterium]
DRKALPKGQKRINIVHKNAGLWMCLFALTSSLKLAFLFLSFPGFREEPIISCPAARALRRLNLRCSCITTTTTRRCRPNTDCLTERLSAPASATLSQSRRI